MSETRSRTSRTPVEELLPAAVLEKLHRAATTKTPITPKRVTALDRRFRIAAEYGVSRRRLRTFLQRIRRNQHNPVPERTSRQHPSAGTDPRAPHAPRPDDDHAAPASITGKPRKHAVTKDPDDETLNEAERRRIEDQRLRQLSVAGILDATFGELAREHPDLWGRRAYLMLVGMLYVRLATEEKQISTDELVTLSRMLAENRRADAQAQKQHERSASTGTPGSSPDGIAEDDGDVATSRAGATDGAASPPSSTKPSETGALLPDHFAASVRRLYGLDPAHDDTKASVQG